ncbi:tRNA-dihydrouridine(20a/20b) synthase [NAD(P)+]-like [Portunus trituberculatus]|uniref:tRNA-dihydrouridine(20a/20b) synthase [NAD(P)+]-like n=1 Tax=Portunus trituberculatus TaxID=210409 RepID=A0A5B7G2Y9_PORTR|nr:tRNA-dihydrouridine(20a/20b) synthase [NAD(P)+]-like [Portunus trituberculatus]
MLGWKRGRRGYKGNVAMAKQEAVGAVHDWEGVGPYMVYHAPYSHPLREGLMKLKAYGQFGGDRINPFKVISRIIVIGYPTLEEATPSVGLLTGACSSPGWMPWVDEASASIMGVYEHYLLTGGSRQKGSSRPSNVRRGGVDAVTHAYCDGVDLNCGCPQRWAMAEGYGACLIHKPHLVSDMVRQTRASVSQPEFTVSVKIRIHDDLR